jgi:hypothetical protein
MMWKYELACEGVILCDLGQAVWHFLWQIILAINFFLNFEHFECITTLLISRRFPE